MLFIHYKTVQHNKGGVGKKGTAHKGLHTSTRMDGKSAGHPDCKAGRQRMPGPPPVL